MKPSLEDVLAIGGLAVFSSWLFICLPLLSIVPDFLPDTFGFAGRIGGPASLVGSYVLEDIAEYAVPFVAVALALKVPMKFFPDFAIREIMSEYPLKRDTLLDRSFILIIHVFKNAFFLLLCTIVACSQFWFYLPGMFGSVRVSLFSAFSVVSVAAFELPISLLGADTTNFLRASLDANSLGTSILKYYAVLTQTVLIGSTTAVAFNLFATEPLKSAHRKRPAIVRIVVAAGILGLCIGIPQIVWAYFSHQFETMIYLLRPLAVAAIYAALLIYAFVAFLALLHLIRWVFGFDRKRYALIASSIVGLAVFVWAELSLLPRSERSVQPEGWFASAPGTIIDWLLISCLSMFLALLPAYIIWYDLRRSLRLRFRL
ncbi:hypothetical protein [Bradyrhizobium betae]|uniref:Uncharacterized protein n=1 Tax=Bradyrhizobium betae TaxID=244734 RepID=A0A4Q1UU24_9BRAD|nr:hypothetical protein [Bradyrhizobium betae]RXT42235.1 hypothetical protein B5V03_27540 [Bradyrhizobium betae]